MLRFTVLSSAVVLALLVATVGLAQNPPDVARVGLEIEGALWGFFDKVTHIGSRHEVVEHVVVDPDTGEEYTEKIPGRYEVFDITLERLVSSDMDGWDWRQMVVDGLIDEARIDDVGLIFYNSSNEEVGRFQLERCWPSEIESNAPTTDGLAVERMVLTCEGVSRVSK
ncbi:MAG: phage tail protein [Acidobacteriota bacterium]